MIAGTLLFVFCSLLCLGGALTVILSKNPIRGAMGLLVTIVGIAGLFLRLNAQFLAAIQLLVYAGAVVILFVFVVMLLGTDASLKHEHDTGGKITPVVSVVLVSCLGIASLIFFASGDFHDFQTIGVAHGSVEAVGRRMFSESLVPFELATVLLLVAVVGALAVARSTPSIDKPVEYEHQGLRMFHGPLMARDAGEPLTGETLAERVLGQPGNAGEGEAS